MNREEYRDICRMTEYRVARLMTQEQLVRRLSEIREYAVEAMRLNPTPPTNSSWSWM